MPLTPMPPEMSLTNPGTTAPVAPLTATRPTRAAPFTVLKLPPTYRGVLVAAGGGAGALGLMEAILRLVTPLMVLKEPATYSLVPSGEASTAVTPPPPKVGRNV